jgi:DNA polymerase-3 subunit delta'
VFVLERVDTLNDEAANSLLKTLEEPASFVHLILLTDSLGQVIDTVVSRCQLVRFDPLPSTRIAEALEAGGVDPARALACARLALGNGDRARLLASAEGQALLAEVEQMVVAALAPGSAPAEPWLPLFERAKASKAAAEEEIETARDERLRTEPKGRERNALDKQFDDAAKREGRRAQTGVLDLGLTQAALAFRDLICLAEDAPEAALDPDRARRLAASGPARDPRRLRMAAERCEDVRLALQVNVTEDLALEALGYRLARLVGA